MKAVLQAGGLGTRLWEETTVRPKPMVEIGGMPGPPHTPGMAQRSARLEGLAQLALADGDGVEAGGMRPRHIRPAQAS